MVASNEQTMLVDNIHVFNGNNKYTELVGSTQVPFLMCTLEIPQKLQHKFFALNFCYLYF